MRAIKLEEDMAKYKPTSSDLNEDNISKFVGEFVEGKLKVWISRFNLLFFPLAILIFFANFSNTTCLKRYPKTGTLSQWKY